MPELNGLEFDPAGVALLACSAKRYEAAKPTTATANIEIAVEHLRYANDAPELKVATTYTCELFPEGEPSEEKRVASFSTTFELTLTTNRLVSQEDVLENRLEAASNFAFDLLHHYHVQRLQSLGFDIVQEVLRFPLKWNQNTKFSE